MGNLLEVVSRLRKSTEPQRIVMLGLDAAGKSTILYNIDLSDHKTVKPTIGFNVEEVKIPHTKVSFVVWDLGGQESLRAIWKQYLQDIAGLVFVVDSADVNRMDEARSCLHSLVRDPSLAGVPIVVVANKQDLLGALSVDEVEKRLVLNSLSSVRNPYILRPTIALSSQGVVEMFVDFAALVKIQAKKWTAHQRSSSIGSSSSEGVSPRKRLRDRINVHIALPSKPDSRTYVQST